MRQRTRRVRHARNISIPDRRDRLTVEHLEDRRLLAAVGGFELLKDINPGLPRGSLPSEFVEMGGVAYFTATTATQGTELWRSDGTAGGTLLVKDIFPGSGSGVSTDLYSYPSQLTVVGQTLFFQASGPSSGLELWKSDGTEGGTVLVKDILPGVYSGVNKSREVHSTAFGELLLFRAFRQDTGLELWRSDGTSEGTVLVKDIFPGSESSNLRDFQVVGDTFYFRANDGATGDELWKSDGTTSGTVLVSDLAPGIASSMSGSRDPNFTNLEGVLYFTADSGTSGGDLWRSDGTAAGTILVKDLNPGATDFSLAGLTEVSGRLYFVSRDRELWTSDGTSDGTVLVRSFKSGVTNPALLTNFGGQLFFVANDGVVGAELWKSIGTGAGTSLVRDIRPGPASPFTSSFSSGYFTVVGQNLFFAANDGASGLELWKTDGTAAGTALVKDIRTGNAGAISPFTFVGSPLANIAGTLFFRATDGVAGYELWKSNGSAAGTNLVKDIQVGSGDSVASRLFATNAEVFLHSTAGGTEYVAVNGVLYFAAYNSATGSELWKTDGTTVGTTMVNDLNPNGSSWPSRLVEFQGFLYFAANDGVSGTELWKSDGTPEGTTKVVDLNPDFDGGRPRGLVNVGGTLYFSAVGQGVGEELWRSDGTAAGTWIVKHINPGPAGSEPYSITGLGGTIYFRAFTPETGTELWRSDGTEAGTTLVRELQPGPEGSNPLHLAVLGDSLLFFANDGVSGNELWKSDGTAQGTVLIRDITPGPSDTVGRYLFPVDGKAFFITYSPDGGVAGLWKTDGTVAATILVRDADGAGLRQNYLRLYSQSAVAGRLFYRGLSASEGDELWSSDGTYSGTGPAHEFVPGPGGSNPQSLVQYGNQVYANVVTEEYGGEIWIGELTPDLLGDFDVDADVDGADVLAWQRRLGGSVNMPGSREDADSSGEVDAADLALLEVNFGAGGTAVQTATPSTAPAVGSQASALNDAVFAAIGVQQSEAPSRAYRPLRRNVLVT